MPIYEYRCRQCGDQFEVFVRSASNLREVKCPKCGSQQTERSLSVFSTGGTGGGHKASAPASTASAGACRPSG